jgi:hypothetical protein
VICTFDSKDESMNLIVATDIFGNTPALNVLISQLSEIYEETTIIDPYDGQHIPFTNEDNAYQYFQEHCGLEQLTGNLEKAVEGSHSPIDIVGFSVGGSSAWEIAGKCISKTIRKIVCFYASRIRKKTDINPRFDTFLIFPEFEKHFELTPVIQVLEKKEKVVAIRTHFRHGFMNKESMNFSISGYNCYRKWLLDKAVEPDNKGGREILL